LHPGSADFRTVIAGLPPAQHRAPARLADWADTLERAGLVKLATFCGQGGMTTLLPRLPADDADLVTIYCDNGSAYLQFWRSVLERRAPRSLPAVEAALGTQVRQGNTTHDIPDALLTEAYQKAAGATSLNASQPTAPAIPSRLRW
jgi:hypothetical protein